jgi:hypothetical protein
MARESMKIKVQALCPGAECYRSGGWYAVVSGRGTRLATDHISAKAAWAAAAKALGLEA